MKIRHKIILAAFLAIVLLGGAVVFEGIGNYASWREEVLLHDGRKLVVKRTADRGGRHEIGQRPPIESQSLSFTLPASKQTVRWKVDYAKSIGYADLSPIMLNIIDNTPYLVTRTVGCLAYNKWGRPNPPYIIFRYTDKTWQQIELKALPLALKVPNMIISSPDVTAQRTGMKVVSAEKIRELNSSLSQPEYKSILRESLELGKHEGSAVDCMKLVLYKGAYIMPNDPAMHKLLEKRSEK